MITLVLSWLHKHTANKTPPRLARPLVQGSSTLPTKARKARAAAAASDDDDGSD